MRQSLLVSQAWHLLKPSPVNSSENSNCWIGDQVPGFHVIIHLKNLNCQFNINIIWCNGVFSTVSTKCMSLENQLRKGIYWSYGVAGWEFTECGLWSIRAALAASYPGGDLREGVEILWWKGRHWTGKGQSALLKISYFLRKWLSGRCD